MRSSGLGSTTIRSVLENFFTIQHSIQPSKHPRKDTRSAPVNPPKFLDLQNILKAILIKIEGDFNFLNIFCSDFFKKKSKQIFFWVPPTLVFWSTPQKFLIEITKKIKIEFLSFGVPQKIKLVTFFFWVPPKILTAQYFRKPSFFFDYPQNISNFQCSFGVPPKYFNILIFLGVTPKYFENSIFFLKFPKICRKLNFCWTTPKIF